MITCPECRRFLGDVKHWTDSDQNIIKVVGICKKHGEVEPTDWQWEDFYG